MIANKKKSYIIGLITGVIVCLLTWFILKYPIPYVNLLWSVLHIHLYLIILMLDPPSYIEDIVTYLLIFVQWFFVGRLGWWITERIKGKSKITA